MVEKGGVRKSQLCVQNGQQRMSSSGTMGVLWVEGFGGKGKEG